VEPYELRALHDSLIKICKLVEPKHALAVVADEPDNHILECLEEAGSEFIITEDRALLRVKDTPARSSCARLTSSPPASGDR
jgi:predicted nucleic acid-binding protein